MSFLYKPDFADAKRHWEAFWQGEMIDRPCIYIVAPKDGVEHFPHPPGIVHPKDDLVSHLKAFDRWASSTYYGGDAVPFFFPNFGPDICAGFFGADIEGFSKETMTSWAVPFITDWKKDAHYLDRPQGYWWDSMLSYVAEARKISEGKFGVGVIDFHSNLDLLAAIRSPQRLCMDLVDDPDGVLYALEHARKAYQPTFDALFKASGQDKTGCSTWIPMYHTGKFAAIQCDFICMISPEHAHKFLYPALEEEAEFLDHCCYHLDGPDAVVHLDDIMSIKAIDTIQWVPGAGAAPAVEWIDLLKRIQKGGKSTQIYCSADEVKIFHKELDPARVFYVVGCATQTEADGLLDWLKANT